MGKFGGWAAFTLFVAAAYGDADTEQRARMRTEVQPLVHEIGDRSTSPARVAQLVPLVLRRVLEIMGPGWEMPEDHRAMIDKLTGRST